MAVCKCVENDKPRADCETCKGLGTTPRFCVCVPYFGGKDWEHEKSMRQLERLGVPIFMSFGHPYIDMVRAELASQFLAHEGKGGPLECMLFIDHDIIFNAADAPRIVEAAVAQQAVVGAPYPKKQPGGDMIGTFHESVEQATFFEGGGLYPTAESSGVGMGFTAIPRAVLEKVGETLPTVACGNFQVKPWFIHSVEDGGYWGEDYAFCRRAKRAGFRVLLDTRIRLAHKGSYKYTIEDCGVTVPQAGQSLVVKVDHKKAPNFPDPVRILLKG